MILIENTGIAECYNAALVELYKTGRKVYNPDWGSNRLQDSCLMIIHDPRPDKIPMNCIMTPIQLLDYTNELMLGTFDYAVEEGKEAYTYHERMKKDRQFNYAFEILSNNPNSSRAAMTIRLPRDASQIDQPCLTSVFFSLENEELTVTQIWRSRDAWNAAYPNLFGFTNVWEDFADDLGVKFKTLIDFSNNFHVYQKDFSHFDAYCENPRTMPYTDYLKAWGGEDEA